MATIDLGADLVLVNGRILTMDRQGTEAEAVAIKDDRVVAVGTNAEIDALAGSSTRTIDLQGRVTLPGVSDIHVHLASDAAQEDTVEARDFYLPDVLSISDIQRRIRDRAIQTAPGQWIIARGSPMQDLRLKEKRFPVKGDLDEVAPDNPTYITFGAHMVVANSAALKAKNITAETADPQGGTVVKDPWTREPTGLLRERAQYLLRSRESASGGVESLAERILTELRKAAERGVTMIHDIVVNRDEVRAYEMLAVHERLPVRVHLIFRVIESSFSKESLLNLGIVNGLGSDWLRVGGIKMSIDGGFTGKNAAFSEPLAYEGDANPSLIRIKQDELDDTVWRYHEMGMRICTHAIGDIANDMILDAYEKALTRLPRPDHRHRVEHMGNYLFTRERRERAKRLQILPIPNPAVFFFLAKETVEVLGPERGESAYPFKTLVDAGFPLAFGSDAPGYWPVDPIRDAGACVSRKGHDGTIIGKHEAIPVYDALRAITATNQWVSFQEDKLGTLEPGKLADITVLGEDPFTFPPERFREMPVGLTIAGGRVTHGEV